MANLVGADSLQTALRLLGGRLELAEAEHVGLVVCGGSALIAHGLILRTTKDVDVVALMDKGHHLASPAPLPGFLLKAAKEVARDLGLEENWLNNGPSSDAGGLFQLGLPEGIEDRLSAQGYGPRLTVYFVGRFDQIHFKLYAAADRRDGTHLDDLLSLEPTDAELESAARWAMMHDVSPGFRLILKQLLRHIGHENVAGRI
jgi:hypothetical protein